VAGQFGDEHEHTADPDGRKTHHTVNVDGELRWGRYTLTCPTCGARTRWSLHVQPEPFAYGERAWRICPNGHSSTHPLIYPEMVHELITRTATTGERPPLTEVLRDWQPHRMVWRSNGASRAVQWHSWNDPAPPGYWATRWPELVDAATSP
jgi:rRNA maturation protein Nop10